MEKTPTEEAEELVEGVVDDSRSEIVDQHEDLIQKSRQQISDFREFNVFVSELRRRMNNE
jgi:hypothetical protein